MVSTHSTEIKDPVNHQLVHSFKKKQAAQAVPLEMKVGQMRAMINELKMLANYSPRSFPHLLEFREYLETELTNFERRPEKTA